ncbi:hypothetical protein JCM6882_004663 [Rhodosporidiobolus microsporus]
MAFIRQPAHHAAHPLLDPRADDMEDKDYDELTKFGFLDRKIKWREGMEVEFPRGRYELLKTAEGVARAAKKALYKGYLKGPEEEGGFDQLTAVWVDHLLEQAFKEGHFFSFRANFPQGTPYPPPRSAFWPGMDHFIEHVVFPHGLFRGDLQRDNTNAKRGERIANSRDIDFHIGTHTDSEAEASDHEERGGGGVRATPRGRRSSEVTGGWRDV